MNGNRFVPLRQIGDPLTEILLVVSDGAPGIITATAPAPASMGRMEIVLVGGERILVGADVDATALARIVKALGRR